MKCCAFLLYAVAFISGANCSRILMVHPFPAPSHHILGAALARGLVQAGHDVTMVSPYEDKNPSKNGTYRNVVLTGVVEAQQRMPLVDLFSLGNANPFISLIFLFYMCTEATRKTYEHPNVQKLINSNEKFDAVVIENFNVDALAGLAYRFNAPLVLLTTVGPSAMINGLVGNPSPPSYIPELPLKFSHDMTFYERVINWVFQLASTVVRSVYLYPKQNNLMKKYIPGAPELSSVIHNVSVVLLNAHESVNQAVPHVPNMINIGGFHINPPKELPEDLKDFMDNAKEGVVYFSMGSNIKPSNMSEENRKAILSALGRIKQKVLWKWDEDVLPGKPDNVMLSKWFPQQDILAHPNTKLFITHGGLLSTTETVYHGVPILVLPVFGDQKMNGVRVEMNGFGLTLPFSEITEEKLNDALGKLLNDPKYRNNAKWRSQLMHDRPVKPLDLAIYWIEFVIRHKGAPHLKVAGVDLPWYKYLLLDVITFVVLIVVSSLAILCVICKRVCCRTRSDKVKVKIN
ncbi:hypothetical protein NQ315_011118 [Exocentrus adspersus]|uniref:UDP-glucuronosyltransferase n=1 Tax=Exocentrus adspersus TaxID=1586481 RepID=A0AAV8VY63_9CUCU|nr:hypothetical protein NQ315_011118 [Exocentrus adspersus]